MTQLITRQIDITGFGRDKRGRFLPGNRWGSKRSGKRYAETHSLARSCTLIAVDALVNVVANPHAKPKTRALAARELLRLGWGRAPKNIANLAEAAAAVSAKLPVIELVDERLRAKYSALISRLLLLDPDLSKLSRLLDDPRPLRVLEWVTAEQGLTDTIAPGISLAGL